MSRDSFGVEVCLEPGEKAAPFCPHGPTLLFERFTKASKSQERFYACSACRDRKDCNFFQWADEKVTPARHQARLEYNKSQQPQMSHKQCYHRLKLFKKLPQDERKFCQTCNLLLLKEDWDVHKAHEITSPVTKTMLCKPSLMLKAMENKKTNAQYLFSEKAVEFTVSTLQTLGFNKVLCIGCPRIHEAVVSEKKSSGHLIQSLLLDIDHRYGMFFGPDQFCRYNMFNHHFFDGEKSSSTFNEFLCGSHGDKTAIVTDPPFGGLVEVLAFTLRKIMKIWTDSQGSKLPVFWFFPYFMEPRMKEVLPNLVMLDYKVGYDNHPLYQNTAKGNKKGSPVRIFTNMDPSLIKLPKEEGYRFCDKCQRYISKGNVHCEVCDSCTSKDGSVYIHCDWCEKCVKPSRTHCFQCNQCQLPDHKCGQTKAGCHICGEMDHKRRDCPQRNQGKKRNLACTDSSRKSKKKKRQ